MLFTPTPLEGVFVIDTEPHVDERGSFARTFCVREFQNHGLEPTVAQCNVSTTIRAGSLRGLHYQLPPAAEAKLVRCSRGAIYDVIVDIRPSSPTYLQHMAVELTAATCRAVYVPEGFAHGYQTLHDNVEVVYQMSAEYAPDLARGLRYNDPRLGISWPLAVTAVSDRDAAWPWLDGHHPS